MPILLLTAADPTERSVWRIGAIARARNADAIATCTTQHFDGYGVHILDPWRARLSSTGAVN
jgi:hypothetical protein